MPVQDGSLHQKVGEAIGLLQGVVQRLDDVDARLRERGEEARRQEDRVSAEIRTIKHEQRNHEQIVSGRLDLMRADAAKTETRLTEVAEGVEGLHGNVESVNVSMKAMKAPLDQLVKLRNRGAAIVFVFVTCVTALWFIAEPAWQFVVQRLLSNIMPGKP